MIQQNLLKYVIGLGLATSLLIGCTNIAAETTATPTPVPSIPTVTPAPPTPTSLSRPKVGQWKGDGVSFTVTENNLIKDLRVKGEAAFDQVCSFEVNTDLSISDNKFRFPLPAATLEDEKVNPEEHAIVGEFTTETMAEVSYSYTFCPNPASVSYQLQQGTRTATWQEK